MRRFTELGLFTVLSCEGTLECKDFGDALMLTRYRLEACIEENPQAIRIIGKSRVFSPQLSPRELGERGFRPEGGSSVASEFAAQHNLHVLAPTRSAPPAFVTAAPRDSIVPKRHEPPEWCGRKPTPILLFGPRQRQRLEECPPRPRYATKLLELISTAPSGACSIVYENASNSIFWYFFVD